MQRAKELFLELFDWIVSLIRYVFSWAWDQIIKVFDKDFLASLPQWKLIIVLVAVVLIVFYFWSRFAITLAVLRDIVWGVIVLGIAMFLLLLLLGALPNDLIVMR
ncbi:MAG TPA: hypothetical protein VD928_02165 [Candidatus Paceibacterota bacterium]|nr:hypothetical protein [Candidatus Paceibacterota bacterium]